MMLVFLDIILYGLHLILILFNLLGWIRRRWLRVHLWVAGLTLLSWFGLGLFYGMGYCFLTDWHWDIKRKLGEKDLPASFVEYFLEEITNRDWNTEVVDYLTVVPFVVAIIISVYLNFKKR